LLLLLGNDAAEPVLCSSSAGASLGFILLFEVLYYYSRFN
jgi:hypothetical protein